jgi:hypothetical protein
MQHGGTIWCCFRMEICFDSFTATSTDLAAATSPVTAAKIPVTHIVVPIFDLASETHLPKPYDIVQGMERIIDMMEETLQICERSQRSTQTTSRRKTFPFGLRPPSDVYTRQTAKSPQFQSERQELSGDLKTELRVCRDPLDVPCTYHKGARLLTLLSLTTRLAQTATAIEMIVGTYKRRHQAHTSSNGTRGRLG